MTLGEAKVKIGVALRPLQRGLKAAKDMVSSAIGTMVRTVKRLSLAFVGLMTTAVYAAAKQEKAEFKLAAALFGINQLTKERMADFKAFAAQLQKITIYGDETTLALMQLGLSLGVDVKNVKRATMTAVGLAAALDRDVNSMMMYSALAEQGEYTMLRRYIPALRNTTDAAEQFAIIQETAARGMMVAQWEALTFSGKLKQLKNAVGDLLELFGKPLMNALKGVIDKMKEWAYNNTETVSQWGTIIKDKILGVIGYFKDLFAMIAGGNAKEAVTKFRTDLIENLKKVIEAVYPYAQMIGSNILIGIKAGLKEAYKLPSMGEVLQAQRTKVSYRNEALGRLSPEQREQSIMAGENITQILTRIERNTSNHYGDGG